MHIYIYIHMCECVCVCVWFDFVGFYGISIIFGYLRPNIVSTYILNIYDLSTHFVDTFLNEPGFILLYTVKWFEVFLSNTNISIYYSAFVCTQLNGFKYFYVTVTM